MLDSATRFFIAVPMKKIDSVNVAEALISQFSIFGIPKNLHMDPTLAQIWWDSYIIYMVLTWDKSSIYHPVEFWGHTVTEGQIKPK